MVMRYSIFIICTFHSWFRNKYIFHTIYNNMSISFFMHINNTYN